MGRGRRNGAIDATVRAARIDPIRSNGALIRRACGATPVHAASQALRTALTRGSSGIAEITFAPATQSTK
jgi:hypothetical protein